MDNEVSKYTQLGFLLMFIIWQLVLTSSIGDHQGIVQELKKPTETQHFEVDFPFTLKTNLKFMYLYTGIINCNRPKNTLKSCINTKNK